MSNLLLPLAVFAPVAAGVALIASGDKTPPAFAKGLALAAFSLPVLIAVFLWTRFAPAAPGGFDFALTLPGGPKALGMPFSFGLSGLSLPLFTMAGIVGLAAGIRALAYPPDNAARYHGLLLFAFGGMLGVFATTNALMMYFFHEFALIPTLILMLRNGGHGRRFAAIHMAVYLTVGAVVALGGLIALRSLSGAADFGFITLKEAALTLPAGTQATLFGALLLGFGIPVSLFPFHSWAPRGYDAAPAPLSMLHAGVLKKFGLYGLIQVGAFALPEGLRQWETALIVLALGNVILLGYVTMTQRDLKLLVSWSSVAHMGACFLGIAAYAHGSTAGLGGATLFMVAHGLSVALLFSLSQGVYERTGRFTLSEMGGLAKKAPVLAACFVAATMASIGLPGFGNFWGELTVFASLSHTFATTPWILLAAIAGVVISASYGLRAVASAFYGAESEAVKKAAVADITGSERLIVALLLGASLLIGFAPSLFTGPIDGALAAFASGNPR